MASLTTDLSDIEWCGGVLRVAAVSKNQQARLALARAFDGAPATWHVSLHETPPDDADVIVAGPDEELPGALRFDPADPDSLIDAIRAAEPAHEGRVVLVSGATGGVGATTVALHLAAVGRACLVEGEGGSLRRRLDMGSARSWADALEDEPVELCALPLPPGLRVLLAPPESADDPIAHVTELASASFDHVVVDAAPDRLPGTALGVLVLAPSRPSAEAAAAIVATNPTTRWAIVTNRVGPGSSLTRRRIEAIIGKRLALELPCSPALRDVEDSGRVLTSPLSPWLWQIKRLWRALQTA